MESVFGILDVYFVGRLGADAVAAVGLTESLLTVIFAVAIGLCMSTTALVARRIGEKQPEEASRAAVQAIAFGRRRLDTAGSRRPRVVAAAAGAHGRALVRRRGRVELHRLDAGRQRVDPAALPDQRRVPRGGRRDGRDARAVARQRRQHRSRPLPHLRPGAVSRDRGSRARRSGRPSAARSAWRTSSGRSRRAGDACGSSDGTCASTGGSCCSSCGCRSAGSGSS